MKEVIVHPLPELTTTIHEVPIPTPGDDEVVIRVVVAASNVKGHRYGLLSFPGFKIDRMWMKLIKSDR